MIITDSESQQRVSARRSSQARFIPLARVETRQWRVAVTPFGQGGKRPSAVLLPLEAEWLLRRASASHLAASRLAEFAIIMLKEHPPSRVRLSFCQQYCRIDSDLPGWSERKFQILIQRYRPLQQQFLQYCRP